MDNSLFAQHLSMAASGLHASLHEGYSQKQFHIILMYYNLTGQLDRS